MKAHSQIVNEIMLAGITKRLEELNNERQQLEKLLAKHTGVKPLVIKKRRAKRVHWTQTPAGRERMRQIQKARIKKG